MDIKWKFCIYWSVQCVCVYAFMSCLLFKHHIFPTCSILGCLNQWRKRRSNLWSTWPHLLPFYFSHLGIKALSTRLLKQASLLVDRRKVLENYLMQLDGTIEVNHFLYEPQTCIGNWNEDHWTLRLCNSLQMFLPKSKVKYTANRGPQFAGC